MRDFVGRLGRWKWSFDEACIISFVAEITLGLLGMSISFSNCALYIIMLMVAPESAQASSLNRGLKPAKELVMAMGMEDAVVVLLEIRL